MSFRVVGSLAGWCGVVLCLAASSLVAVSPAGAVAGFGDVAEGRYYTEPVQWSVDNDVAGIDGNCFLPDAPVSRGEAAVYIWNMQGQPSAPVHSFVDVTDESQDAAVSWMSHNEITTGTSATTFDPGGELTRAHLVTFLWRLAGEPAAPAHPFVDVHADWQQGSVSWAADREITTGTSATTFSPDSPLTRAHLVTFLYRYQGEPEVTVDPASPECDPDAAPPPVVVPVDGSAVTVPAGPGFVADLGSVTVEGAPGVFSQATEVRIAYSEVGVGEHSRLTAMAARPVLLDFGGVEPAAPLTLRFSTGRAGLKAEHVTPAVWDYEIEAWVPTIGDEVTVRDGEIIVKTAVTSSAAVTGTDLSGVTVAAGGFGSPPVQVLTHHRFNPNPCNLPVVSWGCDGVEKVVTVYVPALVHTAEDAASSLLGGVVDIAGLDEVLEKAREYLPKVMEAIEAGIARGLDAGIALVEEWLLPYLADFFGLRADDPPSCSGAAPDWARDGIDFSETGKRDPRLHLCTENGSGEDLRVITVNNRNFGFQVTSSEVPLKNFRAQQLPNVSIQSLLADSANKFLVDNVEALGGYQWPRSEARFDIAEFERSDRPDSTTQWKITQATATLDAILMASDLLGRVADHIPYGAVALDIAECATLVTLIPGVDFVIEQSTHWIAVLSAVSSCLSAVATAAGATIIGIPVAVALEIVAQTLELIATQATIIKQWLTVAEFGIELIKQPPTLTVQPTETPDDTTQPTDTTPTHNDGGAFDHSCGLKTDATITCWGNNNFRQADAPGGTFRAVTTGHLHSCGVRTDATITCWGSNYYGQAYAPSGTFSAVTTGFEHSCGLKTDATITCWGNNRSGWAVPSGTFSAVSAGWGYSCGLRTDATITCWGWNGSGQADAPSGTFSAVSAGSHHSCGLRTDATITCWGSNRSGQADAPSGKFNAVTTGRAHSCGLKTDATITCWGNNNFGQADAPAGTFSAVSAGGSHSCGLKTDATITCWGNNNFGQADAPAGTFSAVSASGFHS